MSPVKHVWSLTCQRLDPAIVVNLFYDQKLGLKFLSNFIGCNLELLTKMDMGNDYLDFLIEVRDKGAMFVAVDAMYGQPWSELKLIPIQELIDANRESVTPARGD